MKLTNAKSAKKKQSFCATVDQLMTSESVPDVGSVIISYTNVIIFINGWRLKTHETYKMLHKIMRKTINLLLCWSTYDVWKHPKCWESFHMLWKINNVHQRMTSKNVWNSQNATKNNDQSISCWLTYDI